MTTPLADHEARRRIAEDLDSTLVVEAAAGTGKTTALVGRIVAVVSAGRATLGRVIAVTFTEKAAGEMKLRLREALEDARGAADPKGPEHSRLERALEELEVARIGTIHALCADLLREHPVEAGVDPLFEVATEPEAFAMLETAFDRWFPQVLSSTPEGIRRLLRRRPKRREQQTPRDRLKSAAWQLVEHRDFTAAWRRDPFHRDERIDALIPHLRSLGALAKLGEADDYLRANLAELHRFVDDLDHREAVAARDYDGLEAELTELSRHRTWGYSGYGRTFGPKLSRAEVKAQRDATKAQLDELVRLSDADLAACLHAELLPLVAGYESVKATAGKLDFFDLLMRLRELLQNDAVVRARLQSRFSHLFVDEFQDTDPLQADIVRLLAADDARVSDPSNATLVPGKLFIVGDPKQSIYRFRRADVALYERVKRGLLATGASLLDLTTSFRAAPDLQHAVNAAFAPAIGPGSATQARYVPLTRFRTPLPNQPSVIALPIPRPYAEYGKVTNAAIDASCPGAAAAFIDWLVNESGWKVTESSGELVPIAPQHVCILFKRFRGWEGADVTAPYTRALESRRIPHVLVGGRSFHVREEVLALRNALTAIEWPDDELSVYATLHGPLFALTDDALLTFRSFSRLHPLIPIDREKLPPAALEVADGLTLLKKLHFDRNRRPIADTVSRLLEDTRAHAGIAFWVAGDQALANLAQLTDLARRFENQGGRSFRAFVEQLHAEAESGETAEAPIVEEGSEGVRMMTVHGAKGLEFPVVLLADPTAPHSRKRPTHWVDAEKGLWAESLAWCSPIELLENGEQVLELEREEATRLAYVAATRARELLVVPVVGDQPAEGWVDVLHPALYPAPDARRRPGPAPGCPAFGAESVLDRPDRAPRDANSVSPGLHQPRVGAHQVVWWDPKALGAEKSFDTALQQDEVLREDEGGVNAAAGLEAYELWRGHRGELLIRGGIASRTVLAAGEIEGPAQPLPEEKTDARREGRPHGPGFGSLVHAVLAEVSLDARAAEISEVVAAQARLLGNSELEAQFAIDAVTAALRHPLMRQAAASPDVRRECAISLRRDDGTQIEGILDLAFKDGSTWVVVDFKTDVEIAGRREAYQTQVGIYVQAVSSATGLPARGVLLGV